MTCIQLPLRSSGRKPMIAALLIVAVFALAGLGVVFGMLRPRPADNALLIGVVLIVILSLSPILLLRLIAHAKAFVENADLVVITGVGEKRIPLANLRSRGVHLVDLTRHCDLNPSLRLWGAGLPGFHAGWFKLRNGEKAVCLLTDRSSVSYLRSDADDLSLLLSLRDPAMLMSLLSRDPSCESNVLRT